MAHDPTKTASPPAANFLRGIIDRDLASGALDADRKLPSDTTVWLRG